MNRSSRLNALAIAAALTLAGAGGITLSPAALAYDEASTSQVNVSENNVILHGYDPVAYFVVGKPTKGKPEYSAVYKGAKYQFASADNLKAFEANPSHYAPQYGGFCAMGTALGKKLDVDPTQFKVVDEKLYLNVNADVFKKWNENIPTNIANANTNWPVIRDKAPKEL